MPDLAGSLFSSKNFIPLNPDSELVVYDLKSFLHIIEYDGSELKCKFDDISVMKYLSDYFDQSRNIGELCSYYGYDCRYSAFILSTLRDIYLKKLEDDGSLKLYEDVEKPLIFVLYDMEREGGNTALADELDAQAEVAGKSFVDVFRNEYGYLFDYVDGYMMDWSVRPNMIFTAAFDYSPLDRAQKKQVLDIVTRELLTPKGLRTLSPKSGGYNPNYVGPQVQRDYAYHQGTAWPWLMGFYMEAYLRIYKTSGLSFVERSLIGMEDEMTSHCIGTLPELFDGNPPFKGRGAVSFAMNVAEMLRILKLLSKYKNSEEERK